MTSWIPIVWLLWWGIGGAEGFSILYSNSTDRSSPQSLQNASLSGIACIFLDTGTINTDGIETVEFILSSTKQGVIESKLESVTPYDFQGGSENKANPWLSSSITDGAIGTMEIHVSFLNATKRILNANFSVAEYSVPDTSLRFSTNSDRSDSQPLEGAILSDLVYIFLNPATTDVDSVDFTFQDAGIISTENFAPFDLLGGSSFNANPFDTSATLTPGVLYQIVTEVKFVGQETSTFFETEFTIAATPTMKPTTSSKPTKTLTLEPTQETPVLLVSSKSDRSDSQPLEGAILSDLVYIFLDPATTDVDSVDFTFQDAGIISTESVEPYDLLGGSASNANPFDTSVTLTPGGPYEIVTEVKFVGEETTTFETEFSIATTPTLAPTKSSEPTTLKPTFTADPCSEISYLSCLNVRKTGNFTFDFMTDLNNTIQDANGVGTGFTMVDPVPNPDVPVPYPFVPGYAPIFLQVDMVLGVLRIQASEGIQHLDADSAMNKLGVGFNVPSKYLSVQTILEVPEKVGGWAQGGLWMGGDTNAGLGTTQNNYCKLVWATPQEGEGIIQFACEIEGQKFGSNAQISLLLSTGSLVKLIMELDPAGKRVNALFEVDGNKSFLAFIDGLPDFLFSFDQAGVDPRLRTRSMGGIFCSTRKSNVDQQFIFHEFRVEETASAPPPAPPPLSDADYQFDRWQITSTDFEGIFGPTSVAVGPDSKVYVLHLFGEILVHTLDYEKKVPIDTQIIRTIQTYTDEENPINRLSLGIAIDPHSTPDNVTIWVAHSDGNPNDGQPNTGKVTKITNYPNLDEATDVIVGLPRAEANHALNGLEFGLDNKLYIVVGGNTGAGGPNTEPTEFGTVSEQPLSAAALVADVFNPNFDGSDCSTPRGEFAAMPVENCDVRVYSSGLRNSYDLAQHYNGFLYATDNGLGVTGTVPPKPEPICTGLSNVDTFNPGKQPDLMHRLEDGAYYGHPNPFRNECVFKDGSFQNIAALSNYKPALLDVGDNLSANGVIVYKSKKFFSKLMGDLLFVNYSQGDDMRRVVLTPDGKDVAIDGYKEFVEGFNDPLCIAQDTHGRLYVGEFGSQDLTILDPKPLSPEPGGAWSSRAPANVINKDLAVLDAASTTMNDMLYVLGGKTELNHTLDSFVYHPFTDTWSPIASPPFSDGVENAAAVSYQGYIYMFGGSTEPFTGAKDHVAYYDPATDSWTTLPPMPTARGGLMAEVLGGSIYVVGGMDNDGVSLNTVEVFHPGNNTWSLGTPLLVPRDNPGSAVLNERMYIIGGRTRKGGGVQETLASVEVFDPVTATWSNVAPMPTVRRTMTVGHISDRLQVIGGESDTIVSVNEEYNPVTNTWRTLIMESNVARHGAAGGTIRGNVYVACGGPTKGSSFSNDVNVFRY